jgi:SulP family sulfate permease
MLRRLLPILVWWPSYDWKRVFRLDLIAGVSVAALLIPESLAYAGIAGVPPEVGLYAAPLALVAYAIFGSSGVLVMATASSVAAVSAAVVGESATDEASFVALTAALAVLSGIVYVIGGVLRLGWVANFLSQAVLAGFIIGLSISIIIGQLGELVGIDVAGSDAIEKLVDVLSQIGSWDSLTVVVGFTSLALLFGIERFLPKVPGALTVVTLAIVTVSILDLQQDGLLIVGEIALGLPEFGLPDIEAGDYATLLTGALAVVLIGFSESYASATDIAKSTGDEIDANQELIAYGMSNIGAGLSGGMAVAGGLSKSKANQSAGAKSQISNIVDAVVALLTLLFLAALFENLPLTTLAAVVIHALWKSADVRKMKPFFVLSRFDFALGTVTLVSVLLFDTMAAVIIGVSLSLLIVIFRVSFPHTAELGRDPGTGQFEDLELHPQAQRIPGVVVYRFDAALLYSNSGTFVSEARRLVDAADPPAHTLVIDGEMMERIDSTGLEVLRELVNRMAAADVEVVLARFHANAMSQIMRLPGSDDFQFIGPHRYPSDAVRVAVEKFDPQPPDTTDRAD